MHVSIRESTIVPDNLKQLRVYQPRARKWSLPGNAHETKSGFWIVSLPRQVADVVKNKAEAIVKLERYYENIENPWTDYT